MFEEKMVSSADGTKLFMRKDLVKNPKAVIVIAHGLAEHLNRYDHLTVRLLNEGYSVYRYDQRGHARSEGKRTFFNDYTEIIADIKTIVDLAKDEHPDRSVFLIGHSMGGFTVSLFGTKYPDAVAGIILSGALTRYSKKTFGALPVDMPADTYIDNTLGAGVCSDPKVGEAYNADPLVEKKISIGLMNMMPAGINYLKENAEAFTVPVLVMHGLEDGLVSEQDSRQFFAEIASEDKSLRIYAKLMHEIFNEPIHDEIFDEVVLWLDKHK